MQRRNVKNVLTSALSPKRFPVMLKKILKRLAPDKGLISKEENLRWLKTHRVGFESLARRLNNSLWDEATSYSDNFRHRAENTLRNVEYDLGGGGYYPLLYFLTRYLRPGTIVETGVAAGYSSSAFLSAIKVNGCGRLYSSDFPYFRLPNPEKYIGILVEEGLRNQ